jgi:hypothetical protein
MHWVYVIDDRSGTIVEVKWYISTSCGIDIAIFLLYSLWCKIAFHCYRYQMKRDLRIKHRVPVAPARSPFSFLFPVPRFYVIHEKSMTRLHFLLLSVSYFLKDDMDWPWSQQAVRCQAGGKERG